MTREEFEAVLELYCPGAKIGTSSTGPAAGVVVNGKIRLFRSGRTAMEAMDNLIKAFEEVGFDE